MDRQIDLGGATPNRRATARLTVVLDLDGLGDPADGGAGETLQEGHLAQELRHCTPMGIVPKISHSRSQIRQARRCLTFFPVHRRRRRRRAAGREGSSEAAARRKADNKISNLKAIGICQGRELVGRTRREEQIPARVICFPHVRGVDGRVRVTGLESLEASLGGVWAREKNIYIG